MANPFLQAARSAPVRSQGARKASGYWTSPAGKHKLFAKKCFALAKRYRAQGNKKMAWRLLKNGRYALALSRQEVKLWKRGQNLRRKSIALHRAYA
ncbi:hypothetical protein [uncultured Roseibium sp.]|uniref:hypothetical protein n=1 Tax=uncultured Roseibium sp. TaxID=1936171 RepID=UPI00260B90A8|nr:hypothetical protein [uncultured Roseibium sp.]